MEDKLEMLHRLCKRITEKLEECEHNLSVSKDMSVSDIEIVDKLTHTLKSIKTTIAMMEAEDEDGSSSRSYRRGNRSMEGGNSNRMWYPGYAYADGDRMSRDGGSYDDGYGQSGRRGRDNMGRFTSRDGGGYSGHGSVEDIMDDLRDMPESERKRVKQMLERM